MTSQRKSKRRPIPAGVVIPPGTTRAQRRRRTVESHELRGGEGADIPPPWHAVIEKERGRLLRADALLGCLVIAMEFESETDVTELPSYPYVAQIARELLNQAIEALDLVEIQRHIAPGRVRDDGCVMMVGRTQEIPEWPMQWQTSMQGAGKAGRRMPHHLRLHRRSYGLRKLSVTI